MTALPQPVPTQERCLARRQVSVERETDVAEVLIAVHALCAIGGVKSVAAAHIATAASELANNLWMHARHGGTIELSLVERGAGRAVLIEATDDGPGIADIALAMTDGFSTGGGLGCGLPGVERLMDEFQIDSRPGAGTRVSALAWVGNPP